MNHTLAVKQLSSIANEARLAIFRLLVQAGENGLAAGAISEKLGTPSSTLSFHLKELNHAGLISAQQQSRYIYYSANYETMNSLLAYLTENCCAGQQDCCPTSICAHKERN
ncbi:MAG TPA: metalloregulator ArsR/SmtB family transcription factor [Methylophilaceae bacterium]|nr:metalloregulator ArsR/SmtB family transcription factor [Methylophilaceae bacterium]